MNLLDELNEEPIIAKVWDTTYAISKTGKILYFKVLVIKEGNTASIITETGQLDGKPVKKNTPVLSGKNIGKANETTILEQAISDAQTKYNDKQKEGYKTMLQICKNHNIINVDVDLHKSENIRMIFKSCEIEFNTDHNNRPKPMLAEKYDGKIKYPVLVQPKYNGVRCRIMWENDKIIMVSREGELYNIKHIIEDITPMIQNNKDVILDGEIYAHEFALQDIVHFIHSDNMETLQLSFYAYDICDKHLNQEDRWIKLVNLFHFFKPNECVISNHIIAKNEDELNNYFNSCIERKYEGSIIRDLKGKYMFGFRDKVLKKLKKTISGEFRIIGTKLPESGIISDFVWLCETDDEKVFEVKPHGTVAQRQDYYENSDLYILKYLQLEFFDYTKDGIPFHITSVTVRDYE